MEKSLLSDYDQESVQSDSDTLAAVAPCCQSHRKLKYWAITSIIQAFFFVSITIPCLYAALSLSKSEVLHSPDEAPSQEVKLYENGYPGTHLQTICPSRMY